jgi:hypothetical protein
MIDHTCKYCNYTTNYKNSYDKHLNTQKHKNLMLLSIQAERFKNHTTNINDNIIDMDNSGNNIIIDKIDNLAKKNEELQQKIEQLERINKQNTNTIVKEARSIKKSILTILNTNFKDTPSIDYIKENEFRVELEEEYKRKIDDETNSLFIRIFNDYKNNKLIKTLSDLTLKFIKKEDKKSQPVFNIDSSRGNFATKIEDIWFNDKSGLQLKKYTLDMIIKYMLNVLDIFRQRLDEIIKKKNKTHEERDYVMSNQDIFIEVRSFLMNTNTHKKVILYMCPELRMDDKILNAITEK